MDSHHVSLLRALQGAGHEPEDAAVDHKEGRHDCSRILRQDETIRDELVATRKGPDDEEFISFVLNGLNFDYNSLISSVLGRIGTITINDFYAELLSFEMRLAMLKETPDGEGQFQSSVNAASRGRGGGYRGGRGLPNRGRTTGGRGPGGRGPGGRTGGGKKKESCQICGKGGHEALHCWYRWDESYQAEDEKSANAVASYGVDTNWYTDSGATDHVTSELEKLTTRDKYHGQDKVHTASGSGSGVEESHPPRQV